ncbi:MAG: signal peptidase II [Sphingomonas sp.]|uniref:signal peptidase II n=1 Tax=Sphingomonas sp. TaxID=28214 RepID=UPI001AC43D38|nr:signal peptidase II [Sphingomonas sp.]MBN8816860.1 signal peptidase II [Sphingomonas sp.]
MTRPTPTPKAGLIAAMLIFVLDQFVKWLVVGPLAIGEYDERELLPIFKLQNVHNPGVSLGFLKVAPENAWMLVVLTGAIACAVLVWMWRERNRQDQVALGMIAGGALGNILDRLRLGYVQDYANLHFGDWSPFLTFNLADAAITIGVLILLVRALLVRDKPKAEPGEVENSNA